MKNLIPQFKATKDGQTLVICSDANGLTFMGKPFDKEAKIKFYESMGYTIELI